MITSVTWIPKSIPKQIPEKFHLTEEEYEKLAKTLNLEIEDSKALLQQAKRDLKNFNDKSETNAEEDVILPKVTGKKESSAAEDDLDIYDLDNYDNEEEEEDGQTGQDGRHVPLFSNVHGLMYYGENEEDPFITVDEQKKMQEEEEQEELRDLQVLPTDSMVVSCKTVDEVSQLEIFVYEEEEDNLYVHHDIMLSSFPLCVERLQCTLTGKSNLVAVGTFEPEIEIWDLDTIDIVMPHLVLGAEKSRSSKKAAFRHTDAVLALASNHFATNILASASADKTVKLWDLTCSSPSSAMRSFSLHKNKVSCCKWHPTEASVLATGGYDKQVCVFDTRTPDSAMRIPKLTGDVESILWNPHSPEQLLVATEDGLLRCFDIRDTAKSIFTLQAHNKPATTLQFSPHLPNCLITGSEDKTCKVWDLSNNKPSCVVSRDIQIGKIFTAAWSPDTPLLACIGGSLGKMVVWNLWQNSACRAAFQKQLPQEFKTKMQSDPTCQRSELSTMESLPHSEESSDEDDLEGGVENMAI